MKVGGVEKEIITMWEIEHDTHSEQVLNVDPEYLRDLILRIKNDNDNRIDDDEDEDDW